MTKFDTLGPPAIDPEMAMRRQPMRLLALTILTMALSPMAAQGADPPDYRPGLGDLMTMTVQPRHLKLGLAGQEKNWAYAKYALHELEEAFERIAHTWPKWREVAIADTILATTKEPMEAVEQAIKASDPAKFTEAYGRLTATCNACHQSSNVGMIVIQVPKTSPFANQDFRPSRQ
jgi:hypothetical protein